MPACPPVCLPVAPVIGHRGAAAHAPENTLAGLHRAHLLGCRWVEFDVRLDAEGTPVLCHDSRVDRTTDGKGRVARLTPAELRRLDAGAWFSAEFAGERLPTLAEALAVCGELGLGANIEIKADRGRARATAAAVAACLSRWGIAIPAAASAHGRGGTGDGEKLHRRHGLPAVLVSSFHRDAVATFGSLVRGVPIGLLLKSVPRNWRALAGRLGCTTLNVGHGALRPELVAAMHDAGYPVLAYTVNDPARAATLYDWGVTSVFSDAPDIILAMIASDHRFRPYQTADMPVAQPRQGVIA